MRATINSTGQTIEGANIRDLQKQINGMLSVSGPQGLTATTEGGTEIHAELFEGQDYVRTASGRQLKR